ncbi:alpha/beta hydrolase family protein [Halobacillus ihumii]|uniref:alpha/beta hydrolase family protein n=1 Tax=Halobacillus ihumii TaxID=2686092 RepID=UPI0013D352FA|nr:prolyl oligopeptidase family serine peptidase [Halobacillus ihumii]
MAYVRHKDIVGKLYIPSEEKSNHIGIVWLPGLPNKPTVEDMGQPLADLGFTVLQVRYPGSWQSYGNFGPSSSLEGALLGLELLSDGKTLNLCSQTEVVWSIKHLVLIGNSYGGGIAVSALGLSGLADAAIALCPLLEPEFQNANTSLSEDDLSILYPFLRKHHKNIFRNLSEDEWNDFIHGSHFSIPSNYLEDLKEKHLLLIHGTDDKSIRYDHTENFYNKLRAVGSRKVNLLIKDGVGHGKRLRLVTRNNWIEWITCLFN